MRFSKTDNIYKIIRITGSQDNILGISFGEDDIEVIEWNFNNSDRSRIRTSKEEVLEQVLSGLESVNKSFCAMVTIPVDFSSKITKLAKFI